MPKRKPTLHLPSPTDPAVRWFLDCDQSGHDYLVPVSKRDEWEQWVDLPEDDPNAWMVPPWAIAVNGPSQVTFTLPIPL